MFYSSRCVGWYWNTCKWLQFARNTVSISHPIKMRWFPFIFLFVSWLFPSVSMDYRVKLHFISIIRSSEWMWLLKMQYVVWIWFCHKSYYSISIISHWIFHLIFRNRPSIRWLTCVNKTYFRYGARLSSVPKEYMTTAATI